MEFQAPKSKQRSLRRSEPARVLTNYLISKSLYKLPLRRSAHAALCLIALAAWALMACPGRVLAANANALDAVIHQSRQSAGNDDFLPPEQAFRLSASVADAGHVRLDWIIAPGYYLYRDRIKILEDRGRTGAPEFPPGQIKSDEYFGKQVVYHNELIATVPIVGEATAAQAQSLSLQVTYQGCAEAGLCYPPITRTLLLQLPSTGGPGAASQNNPSQNGPSAGYVSEQDRLAALIRSGNMLGVLGTFFGLGLLLAFTPCVLPMVPILSGLIAGAGANVSTARAFSLSLVYVLGMAVTYTATGAAFAAAGQQVQAAFQQPWIIVAFAALFVAMSLSMFGLYTLQMPAFVQTRLAELSNRQRAGHFGGVAIMGALSALIVTTCVAPPLVATLAVIGQSGDIARGAAALFAMSLGMGAPLLVVGSSAGRWLPRPARGWTQSNACSACSCWRWPPGCSRASCRHASRCCCLRYRRSPRPWCAYVCAAAICGCNALARCWPRCTPARCCWAPLRAQTIPCNPGNGARKASMHCRFVPWPRWPICIGKSKRQPRHTRP